MTVDSNAVVVSDEQLRYEYVDRLLSDITEQIISSGSDTSMLETYHDVANNNRLCAVRIVLCDTDEHGDLIKRMM